MSDLATLAAVLETTEKNVLARAKGLRILPVCGRCLGSGRYSFNGSHSVCYGCNGAGQRAPKAEELAGVIAEAEATKLDGRFATYLRYLDASRITKGASDKVMAAWKATGVSEAYDWRKATNGTPRADGYVNPNFSQRDADIADINGKMCDAYDRVTKAGYALNVSAPTYQADVIALADTLAAALADIEAADAELKAYLAAGA